MIEPTTPDEDEAFNEVERISRVAQEIVRMTQDRETLFNINRIIEEVAQHIEKLTGFGQDTISSFAIYIREMKK